MTNVNAEMIRLARLSRHRTQGDVAEALGIKQPTYSKIENGTVALRPEYLAPLAEYLEFPRDFFQQNDRVWGTASPHHRKRKTLAVSELERIEAQLNIARLQLKRLLPNVDMEPDFFVPTIDLDNFTATEAAQEVRRIWRVPSGPVRSMTRLLEDAGVMLLRWDLNPKFDAITVQGPGEVPVVLYNAQFPTDRQRFTLAHELGHLCMHLYEVSIDPEQEADEFAREFLMPGREIRPEMQDLKLYKLPDMKRRWKTSMRSVVFHAQRLGAITPSQAKYLYIKLNQEYGGNTEPIQLPDEPPTLLREVLDSHLKELGYTIEELAGVARSLPTHFMTQHDLSPGLRAVSPSELPRPSGQSRSAPRA